MLEECEKVGVGGRIEDDLKGYLVGRTVGDVGDEQSLYRRDQLSDMDS